MLIKRIATSGIEIRDVSYLRPSPESRRLDNGVHESTPSKNYKNIQKFYLSVLLRFFFEFIAFIRCKSKFYMSLSRSTTLVSLYRTPRECHGVPPFAATRSDIKDKK